MFVALELDENAGASIAKALELKSAIAAATAISSNFMSFLP
jgi:hypothetical protein